jgi:hypothetical protein
MSLLDKLERRFGRLAVPHVTVGVIACQVVVYALALPNPEIMNAITLVPAQVLEGQVWRVLTFLAVPPFTGLTFMSLICSFFAWYLFYLMGESLEQFWGTFRYNVYLLIGLVATVGLSFLQPNVPATNIFFQGSVWLAFAFLNPDFELYIFFILPVRIKWLALLTWIGYGFMLIFGDWSIRLLVMASVSNFLLFFAADIVARLKTGRRRIAYQAKQFGLQKEKPYFHRCVVCGITDRSHPQMEFRYCSKCDGAQGYCMDHLHDHPHIAEAAKQPDASAK